MATSQHLSSLKPTAWYTFLISNTYVCFLGYSKKSLGALKNLGNISYKYAIILQPFSLTNNVTITGILENNLYIRSPFRKYF